MLTVAGLILGLAISMTGVGGGVLTAPLLILLFGLPIETSIGTALLFTTVVKAFCVGLFAARRNVHYPTLWMLAAGGVPGALLGPLLLSRLQRQGARQWVVALVGLTVVATAGFSLLRSLRPLGPPSLATRSRARLPLVSFPIGLEVGFSSAGAGALGTVLLFSTTALEPIQVVGTDLVFGLLVSACAGGMNLISGHWSGDVLMKLLSGGIIGALAGAQLAQRVPARPLRTIVLVWALFLGALLAWQGIQKVI